MIGTVRYINPKLGLVAVLTDEGYSIVEILGDDVEIGDELAWSGSEPVGKETVRNLTQRSEFTVIIQDHHQSESMLRGSLSLPSA